MSLQHDGTLITLEVNNDKTNFHSRARNPRIALLRAIEKSEEILNKTTGSLMTDFEIKLTVLADLNMPNYNAETFSVRWLDELTFFERKFFDNIVETIDSSIIIRHTVNEKELFIAKASDGYRIYVDNVQKFVHENKNQAAWMLLLLINSHRFA